VDFVWVLFSNLAVCSRPEPGDLPGMYVRRCQSEEPMIVRIETSGVISPDWLKADEVIRSDRAR
jgi:hypothetical protein